MKQFTIVCLITIVVVLSGCDRDSDETTHIQKEPCQQDSNYECGIILVQYDQETWQKYNSPIPDVQKLLISKGYKPTVTDIFEDLRVEVIYIGDFDVLPVIAEIATVPGVLFAQPSYFYEFE